MPSYIYVLVAMFNLIQGATKEYTNIWVAEIHGGEEVAVRVARDLGYTFRGQATPFEDHYILARDEHPKTSEENAQHFTNGLLERDEVKWAEQQFVAKGSDTEGQYHERYSQQDMDELMKLTQEMENSQSSIWDTFGFEGGSCFANFFRVLFGFGQGNIAKLGSFSTDPSSQTSLAKYKGATLHVQLLSKKRSAYASNYNDVLWKYQWYLHDYRVKDMPVMDHNVVPVYELGYTGKSVTVAVVDDGIIHDHPDLKGNFVESLSYDFCNEVSGSVPDPGKRNEKLRGHGTRCAGVIGMVADNELCGVGIAYNAKIAGYKVLCNDMGGDYILGRALIYKMKEIDIYANSWGSVEKPMEQMGYLTNLALRTGITNGRGGNGVIHTVGAGGFRAKENCASSASVNHFTTIPIASATQLGKPTPFSTRCAGVFATAYSGGDDKDERVVALTPDGLCTRAFTGTSASQAIAAGIIALVLDANKELTYRDVMHLITMTAEVAPLANNKDTWRQNGRGFWVSHDFGFGLLNALNMVNLAKKWTTVPIKHTCVQDIKYTNPYEFNEQSPVSIPIDIDGCEDDELTTVRYLEQVQIVPHINYPYRGALTINVTSPSGTETALLEPRPHDTSNEGLPVWSYRSLHNWGEKAQGLWMVDVGAVDYEGWPKTTGEVLGFTFTLHGTIDEPAHYEKFREYSAFRLPDGRTSVAPNQGKTT